VSQSRILAGRHSLLNTNIRFEDSISDSETHEGGLLTFKYRASCFLAAQIYRFVAREIETYTMDCRGLKSDDFLF
jgi:hypothetical protein